MRLTLKCMLEKDIIEIGVGWVRSCMRNARQMIIDFSKRIEMDVVNTYFKKEEHRITHRSGGRTTQVKYILCRCNVKEFSDRRAKVHGSIAKHHRLFFVMSLEGKIRRKMKVEPRK